MYKFTLATMALMGLASAQSTTELFLVGFDQQNILGSVIASVGYDFLMARLEDRI